MLLSCTKHWRGTFIDCIFLCHRKLQFVICKSKNVLLNYQIEKTEHWWGFNCQLSNFFLRCTLNMPWWYHCQYFPVFLIQSKSFWKRSENLPCLSWPWWFGRIEWFLSRNRSFPYFHSSCYWHCFYTSCQYWLNWEPRTTSPSHEACNHFSFFFMSISKWTKSSKVRAPQGDSGQSTIRQTLDLGFSFMCYIFALWCHMRLWITIYMCIVPPSHKDLDTSGKHICTLIKKYVYSSEWYHVYTWTEKSMLKRDFHIQFDMSSKDTFSSQEMKSIFIAQDDTALRIISYFSPFPSGCKSS